MNEPVKNCEGCVHYRPTCVGLAYSRCARFQTYCNLAMLFQCGSGLREWSPKPPRRSLRRWLIDALWT